MNADKNFKFNIECKNEQVRITTSPNALSSNNIALILANTLLHVPKDMRDDVIALAKKSIEGRDSRMNKKQEVVNVH